MDINELIEDIKINNQVELDEIPELDLYMDQVIQLFESKMESNKRNESDKVLTKTMINNYAKGKLLMPIKNKKYSKEHLILISLIYNFKGTISINDIKQALDKIVKSYDKIEEQLPIRDIYKEYLEQCRVDSEIFEVEAMNKYNSINKKIDDDYQRKLLLLSSMVNMSNMYRRLSEKIIDEYFMEE